MNKNIKYLIEGIVNFNPVDYSDEEQDIINNQAISNLVYKYFPENRKELKEIIVEKLKENIEYPYLNDIDTSRITDMDSLFSSYMYDYLYQNDIDSREIIKLDLSGWDVSNVIDMQSMFWGCRSLEELDISGWDTSNVTDMGYMFKYCESLKELDLSGWDVSNVTDMFSMFENCSSLEKLNLSGWDASNVTNNLMFNNCKDSIIPDWYYI